MKFLIKTILLLSVTCSLLFAPSCQTTCDNGYEGKRCDVPWRDKYKGAWNVIDDSIGTTLVYSDTITDGTNVTDVYLQRNFLNKKFIKNIRATVNNNTITIPNQKPDASKLVNIEGTGTLNSDKNKINWSYTLFKTDSPQTSTVITSVWTKQ